MKDYFDKAVDLVLKHEGFYSKDINEQFKEYGIPLSIIKDELLNNRHIDRCNKKDTISLLKEHYWDKYNYGKIKSLKIATKIFDLSLHVGHDISHEILQKSINYFLKDKDRLFVDGLLGPITLKSLNSLIDNKKEWYLIDEIMFEAFDYYCELVYSEPKLEKFLSGWIRRLHDTIS